MCCLPLKFRVESVVRLAFHLLDVVLHIQLMCTAGKNNLSKTIQLFQVVKRIKSHDVAHEARG